MNNLNNETETKVSLQNKIKAKEIAKTISEKDTANFVLKNASFYEASLLKDIAIHIEYQNIIEKKIPEWAENKNTLPYQGINLEQSSSQHTAVFKSSLLSGKNGLDLTGGLGVDAYFISKNFENYVYNEPSIELSDIVKHNFETLGVKNVSFSQKLAEEFEWKNQQFDWVYLDPSRRDKQNNKLFKVEDCLPNLIEIKSKIFQHAPFIMVKYSPMLDIKLALKELENIKEVIVLSEKNEVKELVFILDHQKHNFPALKCVNLKSSQPEFSFTYQSENAENVHYSEPLNYLYEPNASIMKAGGFNSIAKQFNLKKIAVSSHLYTSDIKIDNFPGRVFQIKEVTNYDKKRLKEVIISNKVNVSCRNFPIKPEEIKKQMKWKEGGDQYLFFTQTNNNKKIVIITNKL